VWEGKGGGGGGGGCVAGPRILDNRKAGDICNNSSGQPRIDIHLNPLLHQPHARISVASKTNPL
jgi:hypothetical protein